ncbi:caspase family protein [Streptomyces sp. IBSBF 2390]|uniref:caspase family protein n=1 Tax=Streptomyces sp. IBSBF 2390 TaxID=2903533 RepID=UPI002FDC3815
MLVGVSSYKRLEPLPAVANNLVDLAAVLTSPLSWDLPVEHCAVIAEPATQPDMLDPICRAADQAKDTLLIYFAGHGLLDSRGDLYFGLPDSVQGRSHTGVTYQALREIVMDSGAQRFVVILDCCMSGRALGLMSGEELLADQAEIDGSYLLAAAPDNSFALAPPGETHTAFTGELLRLLNTGIPGQPRELDMDSIYQHLRRELAVQGRPLPQRRARNTAGRIILANNRAFAQGPAAPCTRSLDTAWPDPGTCHTPRAFIEALADVRALSGQTIQALCQRANPTIAPGTVSALLNRMTLPRTWRTTGIYLAACGLPEDQIDGWEASWKRLRASEAARSAPAELVPSPSEHRKRPWASWRRRRAQ